MFHDMHAALGKAAPPGRALAALLAAALVCACGSSSPVNSAATAPGGSAIGACGAAIPLNAPATIPNTGRTVTPYGRLTTVGNLPTGGGLSPDGRFYWSVSAGHGENDVHIVDVGSGAVVQVLPLPGSYGQMAFSPDGSTAYVSGEPVGNSTPAGPTLANDGGAIHVFSVDPMSGMATERAPITLAGGAGAFPVGLTVTPDGKTLLVALYHAGEVAIIDLAGGAETDVKVGNYPYTVRLDRSGQYAYAANAQDGTLSKIDLGSGKVVATIGGLGGPGGDYNGQPQFIAADPKADLLYVAVTNHDGVAVVDTGTDAVTHFISLQRPEGYGAAPVALALAPDDSTLYVADAGENAVASIALSGRAGGAPAYSIVGKISTADYTQDVQVTPDGCRLIWTAARGLGAGPNPDYCGDQGCPALNNDPSPGVSPYPSYVPDLLIGRVGVLPVPTDAEFAAGTSTVDNSIVAGSGGSGTAAAAPAGTPIENAAGGASDDIQYVFFVVRENRTYDQIFGSVPRGDGDPALEVAEDNCGASNTAFEGSNRKLPGCGTTPNAHALSRMFVLLDRFFEDSEVSTDGHFITATSYATNAITKSVPSNYSNRDTSNDTEEPVSYPPKGFIFDQLLRQNVSYRNYGEPTAGLIPSPDRAATYAANLANTDLVGLLGYAWTTAYGCLDGGGSGYPDTPQCWFDSGLGAKPSKANSHIDQFNLQFQLQLLVDGVPHFNYITLPNDHTAGTAPGILTPLATVADNDQGLGQLVQLISHSSIWPHSAIFVVEDDSQDGADHVEAHRSPALVISPWARHGGVAVHTHYDQYSVLRTMELILGLKPLSIFDANAAPMYDVFSATPDDTPYTAIAPEYPITTLNATTAANAALSRALPYDRPDAVPQELADRILWQSVYGAGSQPPAPGPHASRAEHERALRVLEQFRRDGAIAPELAAAADGDADD